MRFCPACGKNLVSTSLKSYTLLAGAAVVLFGLGYALQVTLQSPSLRVANGAASPAQELQEDNSDPQIVAMRREVEAAPEDLTKLKVFAGILGDKIRQEPKASQGLVFEAIDVLSRILHVAPNDPGALLLMADVSFEQQAFSKSLEFYEKYLRIEQQDLGARARYASTLTFLGRFDDSIKELKKVLAQDPKNFPAMAYVAITYHQKGDFKTARQYGTKALEIAPSEEARARFSGFMESLKQAESAAPAASSQQVADKHSGGVEALVAAVQSNPIAGPKFVKHEVSHDEGVIKLYFKDFPMAMMPPFAKEKFFSGIRNKAVELGLKRTKQVLFVDQTTSAVMETLSL
jgi:tetratricopeptide (TPR) repeat protein